MKSTDKFVLVLVASLFLLIAGCGGGGSSSSPAPEPEPMTCPDGQTGTPPNCVTPPGPSVTLGGLDIPAGDYTIDAGETMDVGEGETEVTLTCSAAADCAFTVDEDGMATATSGVVTAALSEAAMQAIADREEEERMAAIVATTKAAATKTKAIAAEAAQGPGQTPANPDAGLGGTSRAATPYTMAISRDRDATTVKITDSALAGDDDPKFMQADDLGGGRTKHTRTMEADSDGDVVEETVIVRTDIEAPKGVAFAKWQNAAGETPQALDARDLDAATDADGDGTPTNDFTALAVDESEAAVLALVKSPEFAAGAGNSTELTFGFDDATTTSKDEAGEVEGTYNGAMGTYRCNGTAACTVTLDKDSKITAMSDGWVFTPDSGATSDQPDYDYLHYGVWIKKTTDEDGVVTYNEVETFAGSSLAAIADTSTVLGSATYEGGATGVYVHQKLNPAGNIDSATSGHFMADVMLTATFGQVTVDGTDTIADNLLQKISGTINNFMLSGHDEGPGWSVALAGEITPGAGTASGTAKGGMGDGSFSATFHGDITAAADGTVPHPSSVVGEFNAGFNNGSVAGAFGAREED